MSYTDIVFNHVGGSIISGSVTQRDIYGNPTHVIDYSGKTYIVNTNGKVE